MKHPSHSLRQRLLLLLLVTIAIAALLQALLAYRTALEEADTIFDYQMQQVALSLSSGTPALMAPHAPLPGTNGSNGNLLIRIWSLDGAQLFGSPLEELLPQRAILGFSDVQTRHTTYRVFSVETQNLVVQVAQDTAIRRHLARASAFRFAWPIALMAPVLMGIVWWLVNLSLAPLRRTQARLAKRPADDFSPLPTEGLPQELQPLVTELNLLFDRVRSTFEARQHFVADAAHELRSPLTALSLQIQALQRATDDNARTLAITRLTQGIERATRLVEQLLVMARQDARQASHVQDGILVLADLVRQVIIDVLPLAQQHHVDIGLTQADPAPIRGHADALRILVRNLLDNAIKYGPPPHPASPTRIDVAVCKEAGSVVLLVDDSGPGIPPADRQRVFDRFYRLPGNEALGSGLGLAIVKSIADQHDAQLMLDSSPTLGGLRVRVIFPAVPANPSPLIEDLSST